MPIFATSDTLKNNATATRSQTAGIPAFVAANKRFLDWVIPAVCCVVLLSQLLLSVRLLSQTCDESTHLYAGYRYWKCGDFGFGAEHPPLAKLVGAAPLLGSGIPMDCRVPTKVEAYAALDWLYSNDWQRMLALARAAVCVFALGLCIVVWLAARQMFGFTTAVAATILFIFDPNLLASAPLVSTDMVVTFTLPLAVYMFYLWVKKRSLPYLVFTGICVGANFAAKMSGITIVPILLTLAVADAWLQAGKWRWKPVFRNLLALALMGLIGVGVLWGVYGFRFRARSEGPPLVHSDVWPEAVASIDALRNDAGSSHKSAAKLISTVEKYHLLPEAYTEGLLRIRVLSDDAHPMFLLGRWHSQGQWYFFPVNMLVKYTVPLLVLLVLGAAGSRSLFRRHPREVLFLAIPTAVFLLITITQNKMNSNIRHVLPITAFIIVLAAAGTLEIARRKRWVAYLLGFALVLNAASSLHAFPNYLSYANELWGGPRNAYKYVPNNDMGEAYKQVKEYLDQHPGQPCWLGSIYLMDIKPYNLPCQQFSGGPYSPLPAHLHGIVVISSIFDTSIRPDWLNPVTKFEPKTTIGGSAMLVYEGDYDLREGAGITEASAAQRELRDGHLESALQHSERALQATPESIEARFQHCRALVANGKVEAAKHECQVARSMLFERSLAQPSAPGMDEAISAREALARGQLATALEHAKLAVELAPDTGTAHLELCRALAASQLPGSTAECNRARLFLTGSPYPVTTIVRSNLEPDMLQSLDVILYALGKREP